VLLAAALADARSLVIERAGTARASTDPHSPWNAVETWWTNSVRHAIVLTYADGEGRHVVDVRRDGPGWRVWLASGETRARVSERDGRLVIATEGNEALATVVRFGDERHVFAHDGHWRLVRVDRMAHAGEEEAHGGHLRAPMSGTVVSVMVKTGDTVAKGAPLMILEAMKMEHTITAPAAGTVAAVNFGAGERVKEGADLVDIDDD
jgi:3-methylcrotonyl-CoA carboxylase alpha subunit